MMIASLTCAEFGKHDSDEDEGFLGQMETEYLIRRFVSKIGKLYAVFCVPLEWSSLFFKIFKCVNRNFWNPEALE